MFKMGLHYSFGHLKHMAKRRAGSQIASLTPDQKKIKNRPDLLSFRQHVTYHWKDLDENHNFALDRTLIRGLLAKLWGSKVAGVLAGAISGLPLGSPGKERPFGCKPRAEVQSIL